MNINKLRIQLQILALELDKLELPRASYNSIPDWITTALENHVRDIKNSKRNCIIE